MSRSVPWRNKPTQLITQMIPVASQYKLYLVHETGPTSFVFKDDNDNKFKVSIGSKINCSCGIVQNDHCIHTLYVLLKRFRVPANNPIIWQASYLDSELEGFVQFKYEEIRKQPIKKHKFKKIQKQNVGHQVDEFPPLQEGSMCPICYEQMNDECYTTCKTCKKSVHTKCFKIWTRHKQEKGFPVTCPMCRSVFQNPMLIIFKDLQRWQTQFITHKGTLCKGCGMKNIKGMIFKCLLCSCTDLCKQCYQANQHPQHDKYFMKTLINEQWKAAPLRIKKTKKQLFQPSKQIIAKSLSAVQAQEFILQLFPTLEDYNLVHTTVELGIVGNQMIPKQMCFKCKTGGSVLMRRLQCGHVLHEQCLRSMLKNKEYLCEIDNEVIAPGYFEALGVKVTKTKKKNVECVVLKNEQQINRIKDNLNCFEINGFVPKTKLAQKRNQSIGNTVSKSRDKNFRILKKAMMEKKEQPLGLANFGMIMVTGLGQQSNQQASSVGRQMSQLPPRLRSNITMGNYR